jgi:predicted enzyme involved in methoxymalonyl-ACP biosynthesis
LIDGGGKPELAQNWKSKLVEVMKAVVKGDHDTLGRKVALAEHPDGIVERQHPILAPSHKLEQVLASADGVLTIVPLSDPPDPRALELVNKTNQFNLNGRRFNEAEWLRYLRSPGHSLWMASYVDRFGPLGKISVLGARFTEDGEVDLDTWVLSCRAFGRRIEYAMLGALFERLAVRRIHLRFEATERNGPLQELLSAVTGAPPASGTSLDAADFAQRKLQWYMRIE